MNAKKLYKVPSIEVIGIAPSDILATSNPETVSLSLDTEIEEEGYAD